MEAGFIAAALHSIAAAVWGLAVSVTLGALAIVAAIRARRNEGADRHD